MEKVSEKKAEVDEAKGKTLQEVSQIVSELLSTINAKKSQLAPVIQELRQVRQENTDLEVTYFEKKRAFDAILLGLETETAALASEVGGYRQDIQLDASRYHHLQILIGLLDTAQDRVLGEMKAYIGGGGDPKFEQLQLDRGFKSYRDLYTKKIMEADHATKQLKETQRTVKASHEERLKQVEYFTDLRTLMGLKATYNKGLLQSAIQSSTMERDRLVGRKSSMASPVAVEDRLVL